MKKYIKMFTVVLTTLFLCGDFNVLASDGEEVDAYEFFEQDSIADEVLTILEETNESEIMPVEQKINAVEFLDEEKDIVITETELAQWIDDNRHTGGEVYLGADITLTEIIAAYGGYDEIVINTGEYGLTFDGGHISGGDVLVIGEGVDIPVLNVVDTNGWNLNWVNSLQDMRITALGRDGEGGIALKISADDGYAINMSYIHEEGEIRSYGENAIGLYLAVPVEVCAMNITVEGTNASAVYAEDGAELYYCKLSAQGNNATAVSGNGEIVLNTCSTVPEAENAEVVNYHIAGLATKPFYIPVKQNKYTDIDKNFYYSFVLESEDGKTIMVDNFHVLWDADPEFDVDNSQLGKTVIQGQLEPPFQGLGLEETFPLNLTVEVRDPEIPCISRFSFMDREDGMVVRLHLWETYKEEDNAILWRSDDHGESWYDFTHDESISWLGIAIDFSIDEITESITFQVEVPGKGESNIVVLSNNHGALGVGEGGDRTGTDRVIKDKNVKPPAVETPKIQEDYDDEEITTLSKEINVAPIKRLLTFFGDSISQVSVNAMTIVEDQKMNAEDTEFVQIQEETKVQENFDNMEASIHNLPEYIEIVEKQDDIAGVNKELLPFEETTMAFAQGEDISTEPDVKENKSNDKPEVKKTPIETENTETDVQEENKSSGVHSGIVKAASIAVLFLGLFIGRRFLRK